jgi:hypothetical protein
MQSYTSQAGFPAEFRVPQGTFRLRYSDTALEVARALGLDMTDLPWHLDTRRAELVEIVRDGDTTERLHYRVRMGNREIVLAISTIHGGWRVMNFLESDG